MRISGEGQRTDKGSLKPQGGPALGAAFVFEGVKKEKTGCFFVFFGKEATALESVEVRTYNTTLLAFLLQASSR